ncbi:MAG: cyclic beta 1-2 glucan synthetase, partial [Dokdonella sp.]
MPSLPRWFPFRSASRPHIPDAIIDEGDAPLRAELLSTEQMEEHGRALAGSHQVRIGRSTDGLLLQRLGDNEIVLRNSCAVLADAIKAGHRVTPAGEWLLDNLYLIDEQIRTARRHLPQRYSSELPCLERGASAGLPRVYDIALNAISHGDGRVDPDTLARFVNAYQETTPLALGELWAIPIMLRLALIENLRRVAFRVRDDRRYRNLAGNWADAMIDIVEKEPNNLILVVADMARSQPPMKGAFVAELVRRLQGHSAALALPLTWIEQRLREAGLTIEQLVHATNQEEAADQVSISNSIGSLRLLEAVDWREFVENASHVERVLREDPAAVYASMDFATRDHYRHAVEKLAKGVHKSETAVARLAIDLARSAAGHADDAQAQAHVGYYLMDAGLAHLQRGCGLQRRFTTLRAGAVAFPAYFTVLLAMGALLALPALLHLPYTSVSPWLAALSALAAIIALSQLALTLVNQFASLALAPRSLPRLDFRDGVPAHAQTLVVVPSLLGSADEATELVDELEIRFLANRDPALRFGLLTDFGDWQEERRADDDTVLAVAADGITALNTRYAHAGADLFFLLHRPRRWSDSEQNWIGFERKRGKLGELNALLRGHGAERFSRLVGDIGRLAGTRYVITLDTDTQLPRDAARELVAAMEHPLNRPRFDAATRRVVAGYGILQPRIGTSFAIDRDSRYALLFGGDPGLDPYTRAVSDTYQDLFGEGSFTGKGIYDVDAFEHVLESRFPLNRILSHDLLEGSYARSGLITEVELYERYPQTPALDARRRHRWIRGDWQIAEWLFPRVPTAGTQREVNPLSGLSRWKIFDNLRRSLVPVALLAMLLLGWTVLGQAGFWTAVALEILLLPIILDVALATSRKSSDVTLGRHLALSLRDAGRRFGQLAFIVASLPFDAWLSIDAIVRTFWRVHVSRRRLLQWVASRSLAEGNARRSARLAPSPWIAPVLAIALGVLLLRVYPAAFAVASPWLLLWLLAPLFERWLNAAPRRESQVLDAAQKRLVRNAARRTWAFFEQFVNADDHWLAPDNYQEQPIAKVARRTSPTNIGLSLLANLSAHDLGYIGVTTLLARTGSTLDTLARLDRYRGHYYNWYDTETLQALLPQYISTVDSGNLIGHLLTLRQGLLQLVDAPVVHARVLDGLADTFSVLRDAAHNRSADLLAAIETHLAEHERDPAPLPRIVRERLQALSHLADDAVLALVTHADGALDIAAQTFARECRDALGDFDAWLPLAQTVDAASVPTLAELAANPADEPAPVRARLCLRDIERLAALCAEHAVVDYSFLYDPKRHLFAIGYNVTEARRDGGYYDLLASEVRLGVFTAIANGQIPQESWFALGRLLTARGGAPTLLSWSGSMFEYLMPLLVMPAFPGSLLAETCRAAVARQIAYAKQQGVPWGISESGYNLTDAAQNYQYRA